MQCCRKDELSTEREQGGGGDAHDFSIHSADPRDSPTDVLRLGRSKPERERVDRGRESSTIKQASIHIDRNQAIMIAYRQIKTRDNIYLGQCR